MLTNISSNSMEICKNSSAYEIKCILEGNPTPEQTMCLIYCTGCRQLFFRLTIVRLMSGILVRFIYACQQLANYANVGKYYNEENV